ncbi:MAG: glycine betaine ABC transporter substrate-binding protein, partial [Microbacteriaceae bacterium]|nr:glycine betaine ABC transporter substrate-binding protein [Microbacteriaceae bacterium]
MFKTKTRGIGVVGAAAASLVVLSGCAGAGESTSVVVGSFAFPESEILGNIYSLALENAGFEVETQFNLGPRQATIPALEDGSIDLMPEYNGNLLFFYDTESEARSTSEVDAELATKTPDGFQ